MKKRWYLFALAALTLTACSESDEMAQDATAIAVEDTTPVPVQLKAGNAVSAFTKAALNTNPDGTFDDIQSMGIYGLAYDRMSVNTAPAAVNWFSTAEQSETCCLIDNWEAYANGGTVDPSKKGDITFTNGNIKFYPATNFYCYDFYGYYPYAQEGTSAPTTVDEPVLRKDISNNVVKAQYVIDGTQDLIWGRAHLDDEVVYADGNSSVNAYSAPWFRAKRKQPGYVSDADLYPSIPLKHLLTRLTFVVIPAGNVDEGTDYTEAHKVWLEALYVRNAKNNLDVIVASQNKDNITLDQAKAISGNDGLTSLDEFYNSEEQLLSRISLRNSTTADLYLHDADGSLAQRMQVPDYVDNNNQWGESIMLYPEEEYELKVVLSYDGNPENTSEVPLTIRPSVADAALHNGKFGIGHSYKVVLKVSGPESVVTSCTLEAWEDGEIAQPIVM
jgi:hypothetical protein